MTSKALSSQKYHLAVENIGGIDNTEVTFSPGVTVLTGRNATNRTSLLRALMAALGSDDAQLKGDADQGRIELAIDDETYTREFIRRGETVVTQGEPYLEDSQLADLFAFLLESNAARRAVALQEDLREIIMEPVDTNEIEREIRQLKSEREEIDRQLDRLSTLENQLPELEQQKATLHEKIDEKREELESKQAQLETKSESVEEKRQKQAELEDTFEELNDVRSELENVRFQIDTERESISALEEDLEEFRSEREELAEPADGRLKELTEQIEEYRAERQRLESSLNQLQSIIQFNEEMLDGTNEEIQAALRDQEESTADPLTDQLVDDTVVCWTCGTEVEQSQIKSTLQQLRDLDSEKRSRHSELRDEIDRLSDERSSIQQERRRREQLHQNIDRTQDEIAECEEHLSELIDKRSDLEDELADLEEAVSDAEPDESPVLDLQKEINELEFALGQHQSDLDDINSEIEDVEAEITERDELERRREEIASELTDLRTRIDRIEQDAVDEFNSRMDDILDLLEYENIERIWIERLDDGTTNQKRFELHVVRSTASGATYEDTVEHLSESEREVTGLVFALAGYLAHEVYEEVPFMILDSLEAIDSRRISQLVEYFQEYAPSLVVALLPDDAADLPDNYSRISEI